MGVRLGQNVRQQQIKSTVKQPEKDAGKVKESGVVKDNGSAANVQKPTVTYTPGSASFQGVDSKPCGSTAGSTGSSSELYDIESTSAFIQHWQQQKKSVIGSVSGSGSEALNNCRNAFEADKAAYAKTICSVIENVKFVIAKLTALISEFELQISRTSNETAKEGLIEELEELEDRCEGYQEAVDDLEETLQEVNSMSFDDL